MQGSFPPGAHWASALEPDVDYQAQVKERSDVIEREIHRIATLRHPGGAAPPVPPLNPLLTYAAGPFPPTAFFRLEGETYYILWNLPNQTTRPGAQGHYTITTVVTGAAGAYLSRPFLRPVQNAGPVAQDPDAPSSLPTDADPRRSPPDPMYCVPGRDYIVPNNPIAYLEVGSAVLRRALEEAETLDLAFARRMEGLGNVTSQVCWDCLDPDYDPSDRPAVMHQFLGRYLSRFYDGVDPETGPPTEEVADEALHKHKAFCQSWAKKHYKGLTPVITGPAEALASQFYPFLEGRFHPNARLTRMELARVLMRHPDTAAEFASCLHFYGSSLEQARGGRNASYKQMTSVSSYLAVGNKRLGDLLGSKMAQLAQLFLDLADPHRRRFHPYVVDWHTILGQMPQIHRYFRNTAVVQGLFRRAQQNGGAAAHVPPWRRGRR